MALATAAIGGLILAGGRGTRMGGRDKGLVVHDGKPLVAHAIERLRPQVSALAINANRETTAYAAFGYPVLRDAADDYPGPLAGLQAGLRHATTPLLAAVPCDAPLLPLDLVARLAAALGDAPAAHAVTADGPQPTFLLCRRDHAAALDAYLASGRRSIRGWLETIGAVGVVFEDASAFANINTPEELAALARS